MAAFCRFYPGMTPDRFWALKVPEYVAMRSLLERAATAADRSVDG
jgi:hypothetical protein